MNDLRIRTIKSIRETFAKGGKGSGNFHVTHHGIPGKQGGSLPDGMSPGVIVDYSYTVDKANAFYHAPKMPKVKSITYPTSVTGALNFTGSNGKQKEAFEGLIALQNAINNAKGQKLDKKTLRELNKRINTAKMNLTTYATDKKRIAIWMSKHPGEPAPDPKDLINLPDELKGPREHYAFIQRRLNLLHDEGVTGGVKNLDGSKVQYPFNEVYEFGKSKSATVGETFKNDTFQPYKYSPPAFTHPTRVTSMNAYNAMAAMQNAINKSAASGQPLDAEFFKARAVAEFNVTQLEKSANYAKEKSGGQGTGESKGGWNVVAASEHYRNIFDTLNNSDVSGVNGDTVIGQPKLTWVLHEFGEELLPIAGLENGSVQQTPQGLKVEFEDSPVLPSSVESTPAPTPAIVSAPPKPVQTTTSVPMPVATETPAPNKPNESGAKTYPAKQTPETPIQAMPYTQADLIAREKIVRAIEKTQNSQSKDLYKSFSGNEESEFRRGVVDQVYDKLKDNQDFLKMIELYKVKNTPEQQKKLLTKLSLDIIKELHDTPEKVQQLDYEKKNFLYPSLPMRKQITEMILAHKNFGKLLEGFDKDASPELAQYPSNILNAITNAVRYSTDLPVNLNEPYFLKTLSSSLDTYAPVSRVSNGLRAAGGLQLFSHHYDSTTDEGRIKGAISSLVESWAGSATTGDSLLMQQAMADEFNIPMSAYLSSRNDVKEINSKQGKYTKNEKGLRAYVRAVYDTTQEFFKKNGIKEMWVFRGVNSVDAGIKDNLDAGLYKADVDLNPLSSFAYQSHVPFGSFNGNQFYFAAKVPVSRIFSTANTGFGCLREREAVVMGGDTEMWMMRKPRQVLPKYHPPRLQGNNYPGYSNADYDANDIDLLESFINATSLWDAKNNKVNKAMDTNDDLLRSESFTVNLDGRDEDANWTKVTWDFQFDKSDEKAIAQYAEAHNMTVEQFKQTPAWKLSQPRLMDTVKSILVKGGENSGYKNHPGGVGGIGNPGGSQSMSAVGNIDFQNPSHEDIQKFVAAYEKPMREVESSLKKLLPNAEIKARLKTASSISLDMGRKERPLNRLNDLAGVRATVNGGVQEVQQALDTVTKAYAGKVRRVFSFGVPVQGYKVQHFEPNGVDLYRGVHVYVEQEPQKWIEVQLRTRRQSLLGDYTHRVHEAPSQFKHNRSFRGWIREMSDHYARLDEGKSSTAPAQHPLYNEYLKWQKSMYPGTPRELPPQ
jgi:ppGpp synthetase/RelA/SpoT-type nucleotidyltranferase